MTERREILKAIAALPLVASVGRLEVTPRTMVILKCSQHLTEEDCARLKREWDAAWGGKAPRCLILSPGIDFSTMEQP